MGFGHAQSERAVRLYGTVHAALDALLSGKGNVLCVISRILVITVHISS